MFVDAKGNNPDTSISSFSSGWNCEALLRESIQAFWLFFSLNESLWTILTSQ